MGAAQAWSAKEDLEAVDFEKVGLTEEDKNSMINQLNVLVASIWMDLIYSGACLYTHQPRKMLKAGLQIWKHFNM